MMRLLKQPNDSCLLYAAAMVLDEPPEILIREIGHDGQQVWWPELSKSFQKRSFNIQEIIDCFIIKLFSSLWLRNFQIVTSEK